MSDIPAHNDREHTVHRNFRLPSDVDRALQALAARDRVSLTTELALCVDFRERILARVAPGTGMGWALVPDDVDLPTGCKRVLVEITGI